MSIQYLVSIYVYIDVHVHDWYCYLVPYYYELLEHTVVWSIVYIEWAIGKQSAQLLNSTSTPVLVSYYCTSDTLMHARRKQWPPYEMSCTSRSDY